jgi:hypothetical protein
MLRRPITDPAELHDLDQQLGEGLQLLYKDQTTMFGKSKSEAMPFPFGDRLDALLAEASRAGVGDAALARILRDRASKFGMKSSWAHGSVLPCHTVISGDGTISRQ